MWMIAAALASSTTLVVEVVDAQGQPIPGARVLFPVEGEAHLTNLNSGRFEATAVYTSDGSEIAFGRFSTLQVQVQAPGYRSKQMPVVLAKRTTLKRVRLEPHTLPTDLDALGTQAVTDHQAWREALRAFLADPREQESVIEAAEVARASARKWYRDDGKDDALELCLLTATRAYCDE